MLWCGSKGCNLEAQSCLVSAKSWSDFPCVKSWQIVAIHMGSVWITVLSVLLQHRLRHKPRCCQVQRGQKNENMLKYVEGFSYRMKYLFFSDIIHPQALRDSSSSKYADVYGHCNGFWHTPKIAGW